MSEKKGNTGQLRYDFDTVKSCEIESKSGRGGRVTPREFRSFGGNRRILNVDDQNNPFYESYYGPVYLYNTNKKVNEEELVEGYNYPDGVDPREQFRVAGRRGRI